MNHQMERYYGKIISGYRFVNNLFRSDIRLLSRGVEERGFGREL